MSSTVRDGRGAADAILPGPHTLLVAEGPTDCRVRTARWVDEQLASGAKVYYKGWPESGRRPSGHWLAGEGGALRAPDAFASGQLEFCDFATVLERADGGTTDGIRRMLRDELTRALRDEGWPSVAMSQESVGRPMADDAEMLEYAAQEASFDDLATDQPLRTLCQLTVCTEARTAIWEAAAVHHRHIRDCHWGASLDGEQWRLHGELDAHAVPRFGAALYGALRERRRQATTDLAVDFSEVGFLDFACAQCLTLTARAAGRDQRVILHGTTAFTRRIIEVAGRPSTLHFAD